MASGPTGTAAPFQAPNLNAPSADPASLRDAIVEIQTLLQAHSLAGSSQPALVQGQPVGTQDSNAPAVHQTLDLVTPVPGPGQQFAGRRYKGAGADHFISSTDLSASGGVPQAIALPGDTRFAYVIARLRHLRSVNNGVDLNLQVNAGAGLDVGPTSYAWSQFRYNSAGTGVAGSAGDSKISISGTDHVSNAPAEGFNGYLIFSDPGDASHHKNIVGQASWLITAAATFEGLQIAGQYKGATTAISQIQFSWSDASNFTEGKCDLFGIIAS